MEGSTGKAGQGRQYGTPSNGIIGFKDGVKASGREQATLDITHPYPDGRKAVRIAYGNETKNEG